MTTELIILNLLEIFYAEDETGYEQINGMKNRHNGTMAEFGDDLVLNFLSFEGDDELTEEQLTEIGTAIFNED